ncbi:MAG: Asp-tRNA(Asn)/Glu-tRNA(Gln) amidotransferase GatCAB subunit B, partial [Candidatus Omnitrophica bacterium]|nr:Asp-tRNA(Asn)/Glu-tRNA(Gln) amidotransferase GatCAB subunit B [Candidatus Omnitrophota bacterium]
FLKSLEQGMDPLQIVKESGVRQIVDSSLLEQLADAVLQDNPQSIEDYRCGKVNSLTHLMGQAMKRSQGKANPPQIMEILKRKLEGQNKA